MPPTAKMKLDPSQEKFCTSKADHIRLLAPAGCGKTFAILHRCREIGAKGDHIPRLLVVTFTKAASHELHSRLSATPAFRGIRDHITVSTLNAYGFRRMRNQLSSTKLLSSSQDRFFAMRNQLRPVWLKFPHIQAVAERHGKEPRRLMDVMDALKALGFDHTTDSNIGRFKERLDSIQRSGLAHQMAIQFDLLTQIGVLESRTTKGGIEAIAESPRAFYDGFFRFWREAVAALHDQLTFTFEDQKYWCWLDLRSPDAAGKKKPHVTGAARFDHILVDEFQDINALDLALIQTLARRHRASLTIAGDDDQAIFEWRGATPEYILDPTQHLGVDFKTFTLGVNYRSPSNVVQHSQALIAHNKRREIKRVRAAANNPVDAEIRVVATDSIGERLALVTEIAKETPSPGRVAVIGRLRGQLIPYEVFYATEGGDVRMSTDLDALASVAFANLLKLLEIWGRGRRRERPSKVAEDLVTIFNLIRRAPFSKKDDAGVRTYLKNRRSGMLIEAADDFAGYDGTKLRGKTHDHLSDVADRFLLSDKAWEAVMCINDDFDGLRFDYEKSEDDPWFVNPPLKQLADMAREEKLDADDLIERLETARDQVQDVPPFEDESASTSVDDQTLHLMTAHRAKGKEFDTVIMLDTVEEIWPHKRAKSVAEIEAERRLFYVAFTRARKRVVMLTTEASRQSRFISELELPGSA